jgi:hypothetical protein
MERFIPYMNAQCRRHYQQFIDSGCSLVHFASQDRHISRNATFYQLIQLSFTADVYGSKTKPGEDFPEKYIHWKQLLRTAQLKSIDHKYLCCICRQCNRSGCRDL